MPGSINQFWGRQAGNTTDGVFSSTDGVSWAPLSGSPTYVVGFTAGTRVFVLDRNGAPAINVSDGGAFSGVTAPSSQLLTITACNGGTRLVAVSGTPALAGDGVPNSTTAYSDDGGTTWVAGTMNTVIGGVAASDGNVMLVGNSPSAGIKRSTDGITWTTPTLPTSFDTSTGVVPYWTGARFIVIASSSGGGARVATSTDGITWADATLPGSTHLGVSFNTRIFRSLTPLPIANQEAVFGRYLVLPCNPSLLSRNDGLTWSAYTSNGFPAFPTGIKQIATSPPRPGVARLYVAVTGSTAHYSADARTWTTGGATIVDNLVWVGDVGSNGAIALKVPVVAAGVYPTGTAVLSLPALYMVPAPIPPTYWARKVGARERA